MELPNVETVRRRIASTNNKDIRYALTLQYLVAGRSKEIIARTTKGDKSGHNKPSGPSGHDTSIVEYKKSEIAKFNIYTQKRDGLKRIIALPLEFEPLAEPLYNYMAEFGDDHVFNFTRQKLWMEGKEVFKGLTYPIYKYKIFSYIINS